MNKEKQINKYTCESCGGDFECYEPIPVGYEVKDIKAVCANCVGDPDENGDYNIYDRSKPRPTKTYKHMCVPVEKLN